MPRISASYTGEGLWGWTVTAGASHLSIDDELERAGYAGQDLTGTFQLGPPRHPENAVDPPPLMIMAQNMRQVEAIFRSLPLADIPGLALLEAQIKYWDSANQYQEPRGPLSDLVQLIMPGIRPVAGH